MVFTNACYLDFEKEWERNRQVFLLSLKTESINYTFFQLNRHKFDSVFSFDFSQEKYAVCFSLLHANSQLMYIYNQILFFVEEN